MAYVSPLSNECTVNTLRLTTASTKFVRASCVFGLAGRDLCFPAFIPCYHGPGSSYVQQMTSLPCSTELIPLRFTAHENKSIKEFALRNVLRKDFISVLLFSPLIQQVLLTLHNENTIDWPV